VLLRSVSQMRVFNLQGTNQVTCFRIYRETLSRFSCAASIKAQMKRFGADAVLMSGSGPTVFGLVHHDSRMHRIYNGLKGFCEQVYAVRLLGERETLE
ncbi:hypothetical protein AAHB54_06040, partial [Bacillus cereus]